MARKILSINYTDDELFKLIYHKPNVEQVILCKHSSFIWRCFYRLIMMLGCGGFLLQKSLGKKKLGRYDMVIVNEMIYPYQMLEYISKQNGNTIYWLWNTISAVHKTTRFYNHQKETKRLLTLQKNKKICITSFDRGDCDKFGFSYHPPIIPNLSNLVATEIDEDVFDQDIFFAGRDKGRLPILINLNKWFQEQGIQYKFWILPDKNKQYTVEQRSFLLKGKHIPYQQIVRQDLKSRAILDIVQEGQQGLTWRPIEALLYKRKLITNFSRIKEYDFYDPANVFILGEDSLGNLKSFLDSAYKETTIDPMAQYTFTGWLNKHLKDTEGIA